MTAIFIVLLIVIVIVVGTIVVVVVIIIEVTVEIPFIEVAIVEVLVNYRGGKVNRFVGKVRAVVDEYRQINSNR